MIKHRFNYKNGILVVFILIFIGVLTYFTAKSLNSTSPVPENANAIFGGVLESGYPEAGYLIAYQPSSIVSICGLAYVSADTAVSAAHCIKQDASIYIGNGKFVFDREYNTPALDVQVNSGWSNQTQEISSDFAVIKFGSNLMGLSSFAEIQEPKVGCSYKVIGYGQTEKDIDYIDKDRPRKSSNICITQIGDDMFYIKGDGGGICYGDSGSPIFERGSNKFVGVISSIVSPDINASGSEFCSIDNTAIAVRSDANISFVNEYIIATRANTKLARCGESCVASACSEGLICGIDNTCKVLGQLDCVVSEGDFCSFLSNIACSEGSSCILNECKKDVTGSIAITSVSEVNANISEIGQVVKLNIFYILGGILIIASLITFVLSFRKTDVNDL